MTLTVSNLTAAAADLYIPDYTFAAGCHTAILDANGAGKSTLLNALSGRHPAIAHAGQPLSSCTAAQLASRRAVFT